MKKILVSSFEPFGEMNINSSSLVMGKLDSHYEGLSMSFVMLPVVYQEAFKILFHNIKLTNPDYVVCMGQAGGRNKISIEKIAVNINNASLADNNGTVKSDEFITKDGAAAYFTNLPYKEMQKTSGGNTEISYSAGTYICNDVFYRLMEYINSSGQKLKGGFLHLPYTEHFGKMPYMDLKTQLKTIEAMFTVIGE